MNASAGTYESSDCRITVTKATRRIIDIESIVFDQFGTQIEHVLLTTLDAYHITNIHVQCFDKGALDFTIKSRLETALRRGGYIE